MPVEMGVRNAEAIGREVHVAGDVGELHAVEGLFFAGLPEEEDAAARAARGTHQRAVGQVSESPEDAAGDSVGDLRDGTFRILPVEEADERLVDGAERIARLVESAGCKVLVIRADGDSADPAEMDPLPAFVRMQGRGIERPDLFLTRDVPLPERAQEVACEEELADRMKLHAIDVELVPR